MAKTKKIGIQQATERYSNATLWIHETVGTSLSGEASLSECINWLRRHFRGDGKNLRKLDKAEVSIRRYKRLTKEPAPIPGAHP